jgi:phosphoglycolate phosphatase-like HAD superfamily hydrolase
MSIVVVDFSGTLIKPFVAEEANLKRFDFLRIPRPSADEHRHQHATKAHYETIKEHIAKTFGINDDMKIIMQQNHSTEMVLSGKEVKTMIMTDLFRDCMYSVAADYKEAIFHDGFVDALQKIKAKGYKLAIVSGIRTDIITGILQITKCPVHFDFIYGQDPILSRDDNELLNKELSKHGKITHIIGDKKSDLAPAKALGAKSIFVSWGHAEGGEEEFADHTIHRAEDLDKFL